MGLPVLLVSAPAGISATKKHSVFISRLGPSSPEPRHINTLRLHTITIVLLATTVTTAASIKMATLTNPQITEGNSFALYNYNLYAYYGDYYARL